MERKIIRPAGAFPQTSEGWRQYQKQFKMIENQYKKWEAIEKRKAKNAKRNKS